MEYLALNPTTLSPKPGWRNPLGVRSRVANSGRTGGLGHQGSMLFCIYIYIYKTLPEFKP